MADIERRKKALSVNPLKTSQTIGASLAFLGVDRAMPLMHGSQGCTAFGKVFFVRHYREPVPLQTTAMDQVSSVMGADDNIVEALRVICEKNAPALIGVATTGLAETQGTDITGAVAQFRKQFTEYADVAVVAVNSPDFAGSFESGFALALNNMIATLVEDGSGTQRNPQRVNVLCGGNLTPGDVEFVKESIESFGLEPVVIPDLSESLDGHLGEERYTPLTTGGTSVEDIRSAGDNGAILAIGSSVHAAAEKLEQKTGLPCHCFDHLMGLDEIDRWFTELVKLSGRPVPNKWKRERRQLLDAMLDSHFSLGHTSLALAMDPDMLKGFSLLAHSVGMRVAVSVAPANGQALKSLQSERIKIGDLEDLERMASEAGAKLIISNSHAVESAQRLGIPLLRAGFPQYDYLGGFQRVWFGYKGSSQSLFDMANLIGESHQEIPAYQSSLAQKGEKFQSQLRVAG